MPSDWRPQVAQHAGKVAVTFLTYSQLGREAIYQHTDVYRPGGYQFQNATLQLGRGIGGIVF